MNNLQRNKALWTITTALTLLAAVLGVSVPDFYGKVLSPDLVPAGYAQDLLTILVCIALLVLVVLTREDDLVKQLVIIGVIGSFFYLYAIFSIERVYTFAYYLYLAIFSLSFWSTVSSLTSLKSDLVRRLSAPPGIRWVSAMFSLFIAALFAILWISALAPLVTTGKKIEFFYSIYILDLSFVMPAFVIVAVMLLRKLGLGLFLAPAMFIMGIFVIFPLGLGEIAKPFWGMTANVGSMMVSFLMTAAFVVLGIVHLRRLTLRQP